MTDPETAWTALEIGSLLGGLFGSYFAGLKVGRFIRIIKDLGNSA